MRFVRLLIGPRSDKSLSDRPAAPVIRLITTPGACELTINRRRSITDMYGNANAKPLCFLDDIGSRCR